MPTKITIAPTPADFMDKLRQCCAIVEATNFERLSLWREYASDSPRSFPGAKLRKWRDDYG